jgi:hypothetical protein
MMYVRTLWRGRARAGRPSCRKASCRGGCTAASSACRRAGTRPRRRSTRWVRRDRRGRRRRRRSTPSWGSSAGTSPSKRPRTAYCMRPGKLISGIQKTGTVNSNSELLNSKMAGRGFCSRNLSDVGVVKLLPDSDLLLEGLPVLRRRVLPIMPPVQNLHCIQIQWQCVRAIPQCRIFIASKYNVLGIYTSPQPFPSSMLKSGLEFSNKIHGFTHRIV